MPNAIFYSQPKKKPKQTGPYTLPLSTVFTSFTLVADKHGQVELNIKFISKNRQWKEETKSILQQAEPIIYPIGIIYAIEEVTKDPKRIHQV